MRYTPWGETRWSWELDGEGYTNRLYTSQLAQDRNYVGQLYDYGARFYSPVTGRFTSADSVIPQAGDPQGFNRYTYVNNSPLQYADPTGHCPMCITAAIGAVAGAAIGAVMAAAPQAIANIQSGQPLFANIDPGEVARAAAVGAVTGAVAGLTMGVATAVVGTGFAGTVAAGAVSGVISGRAGKATENVLSGQDAGTDLLNADDMARDAAMGAGGAALGYAVGKAFGALSKGNADSKIGAACSFSPDTSVATDNGEQDIGTLRVGDHVLAYDEALGAIEYYTVTAVMVHDDPVIVYMMIDDELIETTPEHPFYTPMHGWLGAGDLWSGVLVRDAAGEYGVVQWVTSITRTQPMYNLTVAVAHTFFVGDGQWLVHNACPSKILAKKMEEAGRPRPLDSDAAHIAAHGDARAAGSRDILAKARIDVNSEANGVWLPSNLNSPNPLGAQVHSTMHTRIFYEELESRLTDAAGRGMVEQELRNIGNELLKGIFPIK